MSPTGPEPGGPEERAESVLALFDRCVEHGGGAPLLHYAGTTLDIAEVDELSRRFAAALQLEYGVRAGDRVALVLQNTPAFVLCVLGCWRRGAIVVPVNPMYRKQELAHLLHDSGASVIVAHPCSYELIDSVRTDLDTLRHVLLSPEDDFASERDPLWPTSPQLPIDAATFLGVVSRHAPGERFLPCGGDIALLSYTSGTTGAAKGVMNTHANLAFQAQTCREWFGLASGDSLLTLAPLFHITGIGTNLVVSLGAAIPLVLTYRFSAAGALALIERWRPKCTVASITAFIALLEESKRTGRSLTSLSILFSGGAPVPPDIVRQYEEHTGIYIHNAYGMTESSSATILVPRNARAPVDAQSGALSVGKPISATCVKIVDDTGAELPRGQIGELVISGPQIAAGYWRREDETIRTFGGGVLRTGDVGFIDTDGWIYIVDRKKDMIISSGFKIWPREVEDVLYEHPQVREAAVVGVADAYRGENVHAFVVVRPGAQPDAEALIAFCRQRLAAYKAPRSIAFLDELPKTVTGKILRRELRQARAAAAE